LGLTSLSACPGWFLFTCGSAGVISWSVGIATDISNFICGILCIPVYQELL